jgi:hypothetical protein
MSCHAFDSCIDQADTAFACIDGAPTDSRT